MVSGISRVPGPFTTRGHNSRIPPPHINCHSLTHLEHRSLTQCPSALQKHSNTFRALVNNTCSFPTKTENGPLFNGPQEALECFWKAVMSLPGSPTSGTRQSLPEFPGGGIAYCSSFMCLFPSPVKAPKKRDGALEAVTIPPQAPT